MRFSTYATWHVRSYILRAVRSLPNPNPNPKIPTPTPTPNPNPNRNPNRNAHPNPSPKPSPKPSPSPKQVRDKLHVVRLPQNLQRDMSDIRKAR